MKVCYIVGSDIRERRCAAEYSQNLAACGLQVDLLSPQPDGQVPHPRHGVNYIPLDAPPVLRASPTIVTRYVRAVLQAIQGKHYDLIHVDVFRGCGLLPMLGRRSSNVWFADVRTGNVIQRGWRATLADRLTVLETSTYRHRFVTHQGLGDRLFGRLLPFTVLEQGTDLQRFAGGDRQGVRCRLGLADDEPLIIYTGALTPERNPMRILESFAQAAAQVPRARLLIVGNSPNQAEFQAWSQQQGLAHRIHFTGRVPYEAIPDYLAAADIGFAYVPVTPNFAFQPPLKTAEFLAAGLPTLATDSPGNRFYVEPEQNGLLAPDEVGALGTALTRLLTEPELAVRLRRSARSSVMKFDWRIIVESQLLPAYRRYAGMR